MRKKKKGERNQWGKTHFFLNPEGLLLKSGDVENEMGYFNYSKLFPAQYRGVGGATT